MVKLLVVCAQLALVAGSGTRYAGDWIGQDIGPVKVRGSAAYDEEANVWIVRGDSADTHDTEDAFHYVYRRLQGNGVIVARVETMIRRDVWTKVGVMIRENLDPASRFAAVYASARNGVSFQARLSAGAAVATDVPVAPEEQKAVVCPVWVKLERQGNRFHGYYATDTEGKAWVPMVWKPQTITMPEAVYVGLAVTSHDPGNLCEAQFSRVSLPGIGITDAEIATDPKLALANAYQNLQQLGNWRGDADVLKEYGDLIASSLFAIARVGELRGQPAAAVLAAYRRVVELVPDAPSQIAALVRMTIVDREEGWRYTREHLQTKRTEDQDRFYLMIMKEGRDRSQAEDRERAVEPCVAHIAATSNLKLLEQVITSLGGSEHTMSMYQSLIRHCMAQPSGEPMAITGLRYMALRRSRGWGNDQVLELGQWAAAEFKDTKLAACAMGAMADVHYERGNYVGVVEVFHSGLLQGNLSEASVVANIESALTSYRANTLLPGVVHLEPLYDALGQEAGKARLPLVALHCYRKIAETRKLSLEDFQRTALQGVAYCASTPDNEVWFWKGLIAADDEDLGVAAAAYERFLQGDGRSVLAARAYYDLARARMAVGEDARESIAKAKALSPCDAVVQLERRLDMQTPHPG